jgi:hypothetical protein
MKCQSLGLGVQERGGTCCADGGTGMQEVGNIVLEAGQNCRRWDMLWKSWG